MSRVLAFLRAAIPDFLLVLLSSFGTTYALLSAWDATVDMRSQVFLIVGIAALMLAILFLGSLSKRAALISGVVACLCGVAIVGAALSYTPASVSVVSDGFVNDEQGNYLVFALVAVLVPVVSYLLSRRFWGCVVLVALATLICCGVQFLFRDWMASEGGLVAFLASFFGAVCLLVFQRFRANAAKAQHMAKQPFMWAFLFTLAVVGLSVGAGAGIFYGVIEPLGLSTPIIKPFEMRIMRPVIEYTGIYDVVQVENPDIRTSLMGDEETDTNQPYDGGQVPQEDQQQMQATNPLVQFVQSLQIFNDDSWDESVDPQTYDQLKTTLLWVLFAVVAALAAAVGTRIWWRKRRISKLAALPPAKRVAALYEFFRGRFVKLGIKAAPSQTPLEFAFARHNDMQPWDAHTGKVSFVRVTLLYQRAAYGTGDIGEAEYQQVLRYYWAFFKNTHEYVGTLRWLYLFWRV